LVQNYQSTNATAYNTQVIRTCISMVLTEVELKLQLLREDEEDRILEQIMEMVSPIEWLKEEFSASLKRKQR